MSQYRLQRVAIGTRQLTTARCKTTGRFHKAGCRINRSIRRRLRAQLLGQRVGTQQQVLYVLEVATGFRQAIYRGGRADFVFSGFRAELFQHRRQRVITATTGQTACTTGSLFKAGSRINRAVSRLFRAQRLGQRVGTGDQILNVAKGGTGFGQTVDGRGRAHFACSGFRTERLQHRCQRVITATTGQAASTTGRFFKAGSRIDRRGLGRFRAQVFCQRVRTEQQILHVLEVATGFRQAIYRGGRADFVFSGFRTELFQHWRQRVITATAGQTASTTGRFFEAGCRVNRRGLSRFRAQVFRQRVRAQQQVLNVTKRRTGFSQTVDGRGRAHFTCSGFRTELFQYWRQRVIATTATGQSATANFHEAGCWINRRGLGRFRTQVLGQRVRAQQQVLHIFEITARFRQTVHRGCRADRCGSGIRTELFQYRRKRVAAIATARVAGETTNTHGRFGEAIRRVHSAIRRILRTDLFCQRIGRGDHVDDGDIDTAGFIQTRGWRGRVGRNRAGFRAKLLGNRVCGAIATVTTTGQIATSSGFCEAVGRVNVTVQGFFRADRLGNRVGTAQQIACVLKIARRFLQTSRSKGAGLLEEPGQGSLRIFLQHGRIKQAGRIKGHRRIRAELLDNHVL